VVSINLPDVTAEALTKALFWLDYAAVIVFGASGALSAAKRQHDIITFGFFAAITGVGGGTIRDLLIGAPVFWVTRPSYIILCLLAALGVWFLARRGWRFRALLWLDALGMSAYAVVGCAKAIGLGVHPISAIVMGVITAAFGGVIRDVLAGEPNLLLRREIYITSALLGASVFAGLTVLGIGFWMAGITGFISAFGLRAAAIYWSLSLPGFNDHSSTDDNPKSD
jgi:uncharacterized membrane protein YeiH